MTGYELRLWRKGQKNWVQERAAEELGVSIRTYKSYEKLDEIPRVIELAIKAISLREICTHIEQDPERTLQMVKTLI